MDAIRGDDWKDRTHELYYVLLYDCLASILCLTLRRHCLKLSEVDRPLLAFLSLS